jgi:hypothetical protein
VVLRCSDVCTMIAQSEDTNPDISPEECWNFRACPCVMSETCAEMPIARDAVGLVGNLEGCPSVLWSTRRVVHRRGKPTAAVIGRLKG